MHWVNGCKSRSLDKTIAKEKGNQESLMAKFTGFYFCPVCNYKTLQIKIVTGRGDRVKAYESQCLMCGYSYDTDGRENGGRGTYKADGENLTHYPSNPTHETVEAWACQQEARGIIVKLATCFDDKDKLTFVRGEPPDWVGFNPMELGYTFRRVVAFHDGEDLQCVPCKVDDPRRNGWAVFTRNADGSLKREAFGNDLLILASSLEPFNEEDEKDLE